MSTTLQQQPSFALNTQNIVVGFNDTMLPDSPSSTPPKRSSNGGSSSGLGIQSKNEASSEEALSLTSESANNGPSPITHGSFMAPSNIRFVRPPPPHLFYTAVPNLAAGATLPNSSPNVPTLNTNTISGTNNLPQSNGNLQAPSPPTTAIPGIPNTASINAAASSNDLFVHVEQGETISLAVGNEIQHIAGPATIRMVGHSGVNSPLPLHVPRGHSISQIVDEKGILRHLILSPQNGLNMPLNSGSGLAPPIHIPQSLTPTKPSVANTSALNNLTPTAGHSPPKSTSPPNSNMVPSYPPPSTTNSASVSNSETNAQRKRPAPTNKRNSNGNQVQTDVAYNGTPQENTHVIDKEERDRLLEGLNRICQPTVTRIGAQDADVHWQELDTSEAAASGGPFPQVDQSEFLYEIFLYENSPNGRLLTQKACPPLSNYNGVRLTRLKPLTDYHVAIRASLPERKLVGCQSQTLHFKTHSLTPDPPQYLRVVQRGVTYLTFSWACPTNCGNSPVIGYILQITKGKTSDNYESVYEGPAEQARINRLEPATSYKARIAAQSETGRSEFTNPIVVNTTLGMQHQQSTLPTTSASTSTAMNYYPVYPPLQTGLSVGAGVPSITHYGHLATPSPMFPLKIAPPTLLNVSSRSARFSWQQPPITDISNITLEMTDASRPYNFAAVPNECYNATKTGANVLNLKSNRDYRFRLTASTSTGDIRSDYTVVKTHKDRYENTAYYQTEKDRLPVPSIQKIYEDDTVIELSWKYQNYEYDNVTFVLEGSSSFAAPANSSFSDSNSNEVQWKLCYKGPETTYNVRDVYLVAFRVQAIKRNISSPWSETCFARRSAPRNKRQTQNYGQKSQYHNQVYSNQQYQAISTQQSTPPMSQKSDSSIHQSLEVHESISSPPIKPSGCTIPKLSNITQSSIDISWKATSNMDLNADDNNKHSLIYELQRVDKQAIIIYSGSETHFLLENLRAVEHVQVRARAVILDYEGQRTEGDWSSIGSGITLPAVTSSPQNLRIKSESSPFTIRWDPPAQINGSDVIEYLVISANFAMEENKSIDSLVLQQLASTAQLEYSIDTLLPAHIYVFSVISRNEAGKSIPSERLEFTSPPTVPSPPVHLRLEATSFETLCATWHASASNGAIVEAYKLTLYHDKSVVRQETVYFDVHQYIFTNLDAEKQYTLEAQAKNNVGWSRPVRVSCSTLQLPPEPPQISLVQATSNTLKLKWSSNGSSSDSDLLYFYLEKENENGKPMPVYEGENHSTKIKGLRESSTHRFRIRASRVRASPQLAGQWSSFIAFQTTRQPPPGIKSAPIVSEIQPGLLQVEWQSYNKGARDSSEDIYPKNIYYKLQTAPKGNRDKVSENWKTCYQGSSTTCTLNVANSTSSTLPTTKQYRVLVVQKYEDKEEVQSIPSPIATFNIQRTPTDSPRKRSTKQTSGQSTPSSLVSGRSASNTNTASGRVNSANNPLRVPSHKLSLYKRFMRIIKKRPFTERDGAFLVLTAFVCVAIGIAVILNNYYNYDI